MKSKGLERLLRLLLVLLGIGIGLAIFQVGLQWYQLANASTIPAWVPPAGYIGMGLLGGIVFLLLSGRILRRFTLLSGEMQKQMDKMPLNQLMSAVIGLILGLIVAALLRNVLAFLGNSMATMMLSAILYAALGALGYSIGKRRSREFMMMLTRLSGVHEKRKTVRRGYASRKFLDTSALVDGRVTALIKTGVLEGEIVLPRYVIFEAQTLADSSDAETREKGRRALETARTLQTENLITVDDSEDTTTADVDVKLMRAARDCGGTVITTDTTLQKAAAVSGVRAVNLHALAEAMRPAVTEGMTVSLRIAREGKEAGQGIGHLPDGTMVVVENGKEKIGEETEVTVTAVRQTSGGRMLFARLLTAVVALSLMLGGAALADTKEPKADGFTKGDLVVFGAFPQTEAGDDMTPIDWQVLTAEDGKVLLLSLRGLDARPYHDTEDLVTWETCSLRAWLNGEFLETAFSEEERGAILLTEVDNSREQAYKKWKKGVDGENTQDYVFLLSYGEAHKYLNVQKDNYQSRSRQEPTAYAIAHGAHIETTIRTAKGKITGWWLLRSPGKDEEHNACVNNGGGLSDCRFTLASGCIRPVIWVQEEALTKAE